MGVQTATEVTAARIVLSGGKEKRLFTATTTGTDDFVNLSTIFENIYFARAWDTADGTDAEAYVAGADNAADDLTFKQNKGDIYIEVEGTAVSSRGGTT